MRNEIIQKVETFMRTELMKLADYQDNIPRMAEYRIEHSFRVAHIAADIARLEGLDEERACVAGLLHDIGYSVDYKSREDYRNHGRVGARIARPFLEELGCYDSAQVNEICYGIAIHVDDASDFPGERTPLALTVQDADNIDRFDAFRLYEGLQNVDYMNLSLAEQRVHVERMLSRLPELRILPCGTVSAAKMWEDRIDFRIEFYKRLKQQLDISC